MIRLAALALLLLAGCDRDVDLRPPQDAGLGADAEPLPDATLPDAGP